MSGKKLSAGKLAAMIFCFVTVVALGALLFVSIYTGGQIKTINSVYTAVVHDIYSDYAKCFSDSSEKLSESAFEALRQEYIHDYGEDFRISADFVSREEIGGKKFAVTVKTTVYNDVTSASENCSFIMKKQGGKWVISE